MNLLDRVNERIQLDTHYTSIPIVNDITEMDEINLITVIEFKCNQETLYLYTYQGYQTCLTNINKKHKVRTYQIKPFISENDKIDNTHHYIIDVESIVEINYSAIIKSIYITISDLTNRIAWFQGYFFNFKKDLSLMKQYLTLDAYNKCEALLFYLTHIFTK